MDKKVIIIPVAMLSLVFLAIFVHELGHFYMASQYDLNPTMHLFSSPDSMENNSFLMRGIAYVNYKYFYYKKTVNNETIKLLADGQDIDIINRKVLFSGLWFEMILLTILSGIVMVITFKREDWLLFILTGVIFAMILGIVIEWNLINVIPYSDLYLILYGG